MKRSLLLLCLVAVIGGADEPRLRGVVLDPGGDPLPGARITLQAGCCLLVPGYSGVNTTTDADGRFSLPEPPPGMEVRVAHADHPAVTAETGTVVRMRDACFLEGTVSAPAAIEAVSGLVRLAVTKADGAFRLGPLTEGEAVTLLVRSPRHRPYQRRLVPTSEPVRIELDEGLALEGRVVPAAAGITVRASQGEMRESRAATAEDGSFRLTGLRRGPATLVLLEEGRAPLVVSGQAAEWLEVRR